MIPPEAIDRLCILLRVNEVKSTCAIGLVRARSSYLRTGINRDKKTSFSAAGRTNIWWLVQDYPYSPNFWNLIDEDRRKFIMAPKGGTKRLVRLFESCIGQPISRVLISSVAAQDDFMKRLRRNGGARDALAAKGIAILYSENDHALMQSLGIRFGYREFVSFKAKTANEEEILRNAGKID